ncbi:MAG: LURP-one-related family protein [Clostridiales bacterium]|nr:LURP-one-related family protein [Clostridiales bacterium]
MKLLFKQRLFSWFDSYDIYDEEGNTVFVVKGQLSWGHRLNIFNSVGEHIATVKEVMLTFLPRFELYIGEQYAGCISKEFSFFKPRYNIDCNGWSIDGNFLEWDYRILGADGQMTALITKEVFNWTDTYSIEVANPEDGLMALMVVLAIDAEKFSRK